MSRNDKILWRDRVALETVSFALTQHNQILFDQLKTDVGVGRDILAKNDLELLLTLSACQRIVENAGEVVNGRSPAPLFVCSAWFLTDCLAHFAETESESMLFVSGAQIANVRTFDRVLKARYSEQSLFRVTTESESYRRLLHQLDSHGQSLLGWFHSHPGHGPSSVNPSPTDKENQMDLEQGKYVAIGAVFARDGHVRFFSHASEFNIEVLGKGVRKIEDTLFQLTTA